MIIPCSKLHNKTETENVGVTITNYCMLLHDIHIR